MSTWGWPGMGSDSVNGERGVSEQERGWWQKWKTGYYTQGIDQLNRNFKDMQTKFLMIREGS